MVVAQSYLVRSLGISKLVVCCRWFHGRYASSPMDSSLPEDGTKTANTDRHFCQTFTATDCLNEVGRQAIMADPDWKEGQYYGLCRAIPRLGGCAYDWSHHLHERCLDGREIRAAGKRRAAGKEFSPDFEVEGYLQYRGDKFS